MTREWVSAWIAAALLFAAAWGCAFVASLLGASDVVVLAVGVVAGSVAMAVWIGRWRP